MDHLRAPLWPRVGPLCLLLAGAAWAPSPSLPDPKFESKAALLASRGTEELLCFTQRLEDLVCFWEEAASSGMGFNYSFSYQLEGESRKSCRLHQAPTVRGSVRFWCSLPTADTSSFVPLELRVTAASGSPRYHRIIHINEVVLLDAPAGLLARRAEEGSHVVLRWLPPPGAPMTTHIRYEVDVSAGNRAGGTQRVEVLEGRTECVLSNLRGGTRYTFAVRARMAEPSFSGFWSAWSEPASLLTASDLDPLILTLSLILVLISLLLAVLALLSHRRTLKQKIWPGIPSPESEFEGLFTTHKGNFQSPCSEDLSGSGDSVDPVTMDEGSEASSCPSELASKPRPEGTSPSSFEYTILDPNSQRLCPRALPPELPPTPPHLKYLYLVVSDSGISTDYSLESSQGVHGDSSDGPYSHPYENSLVPDPEPRHPSYVACS